MILIIMGVVGSGKTTFGQPSIRGQVRSFENLHAHTCSIAMPQFDKLESITIAERSAALFVHLGSGKAATTQIWFSGLGMHYGQVFRNSLKQTRCRAIAQIQLWICFQNFICPGIMMNSRAVSVGGWDEG
jgi:hypothetical protein